MEKESYTILVIGPTGAGKSQFCNFVQKDITNSKNKVNHGLKSCTKDVISNEFERNGTKYDFIDTAGSSDSDDKDKENLDNLISFLKNKKKIDYILLLLSFGERLTAETKKYINNLNKIFVENDFYTHLSIIFTKYPEKPKKKHLQMTNDLTEEINSILKETFNIKQEQVLPEVKVYYLDTEVDEDTKEYIQKFQDTIDIILEQIKLNVYVYGSIDTCEFDNKGVYIKTRRKCVNESCEELKKKFEVINREKQELKKDLKNNIKKNRLKNIEEMEEKLKEKIGKLEEEIKFRQNKIDNEARYKGVSIGVLLNVKGGFILSLIGGIISPFCPHVGIPLILTGLRAVFIGDSVSG